MRKAVKIVRTSEIIYLIQDGDMPVYEEEGCVNIDMAANYDRQALENGEFEWDDLESSAILVEESTYEFSIVTLDDLVVENERKVSTTDTTRDEELFPSEEEENV